MTDTTMQKLVLQLLPAVAASRPRAQIQDSASLKKMWDSYLDEARSVALLYEAKFLLPASAPTEVLPKVE